MKYICFGAGAIGSYVGGSLAIAGFPVVFIEREALIPRLHANGITIERDDNTKHFVRHPMIYSDVREALEKEKPDIALLAIKSFDTAALIESLRSIADLLPPFVTLQNGVENEVILRGFLGDHRVIPASVCTAISRRENGMIKVEKLRGIGIFDGNPLSAQLEDDFDQAGLKPGLLPNAEDMKWSKMISNLLSNAGSAIFNMKPAELYNDPAGFALEMQQIREALRVMDAHQIHAVNLPGLPIGMLCWAIRHLPDILLKPILMKAIGGGRGAKMPSFHIDLYQGHRQTEAEFLNGAVIRYARQKEINAPVNQKYWETITAMAEKRIPLNDYEHQPMKLKRELDAR